MSRSISRRRFLSQSLGFSAIALLPACGQATPPQASDAGATPVATQGVASAPTPGRAITIDYWHYYGAGPITDALNLLASQFNTQHAGAISVTPIAQGEYFELGQKLRTAASAGGLPPAFLCVSDQDVPQYTTNEMIVPLDPYFSDPTYGLSAAERADFLPGVLEWHKLPLYGGNTMAYPMGTGLYAGFWNRDALAAADIPTPPPTWDDFGPTLRRVAAAMPQVKGWAVRRPTMFLQVLQTYGVNWYADDGTAVRFDQPEVRTALAWWSELAAEQLLILDDAALEAFAGGRSVFMLDGANRHLSISELTPPFAWDSVLPPQGSASNDPHTSAYGVMNAVAKSDPETQLAAWQWVKFLASPAAQSKIAAAVGYTPVVRSAADYPELIEYLARYPIAAAQLRDIAPYARLLPVHPAATAVDEVVGNVLTELVLGRLSADDASVQLQTEASAALNTTLAS